jgi:hypothetical protein
MDGGLGICDAGRMRSCSILGLAVLALLPRATQAAEPWQSWADDGNGMVPGYNPRIAISGERELFYSYYTPQDDGIGEVYRVSLDDPARQFTLMPGFPLPTPPPDASYANVSALGVNARGEPVVGIAVNAGFVVTDPMLFTWDAEASDWIAAQIVPADEICTRLIRQVALAPNGDVWATCQWSGAYRSTDDGRTFEHVDVTAAVVASEPSYVPTRANGASDLGALFGLVIGPDGSIYVGTESGGVVYSDDEGATFRPLDQDPTNLMSTMARATNSGNIAGVGLTLDGKVIVQGAAGQGAYPPPGPIGVYVFDIAAQTTDVAVGLPDYVFNGLTVGQIVTLPSGRIYMHSTHDTVDTMTGRPTFGGIVSSDDALTWEVDNAGIDEAFMIPTMGTWYDGNGHGESHPFATDGDDIYVATSTGKIFVRYGEPGGGTDTGTETGTGEGSDSGPGPGSADTSGGALTSGSSQTEDGGGASSSGRDDAGQAEGGSGCGCRSRAPRGHSAWAVLVVWLAWHRRRRRAA